MLKRFPLWRSLAFVFLFFTLTPIALGTSFYSLAVLANKPSEGSNEANLLSISPIELPLSGVKIFASLPAQRPAISGLATVGDARVEIIKKYLERYDSPLLPYAKVLVENADEHNLDFRLVTAIAQQESNLCKRIPPGSYNCWGWGIHSRGSLGFESFEVGIATVSRGLREEYLNKGFETLEEIMSKYTPLSPGSWAIGVNQFMAQMQ